MTFTRAAVFGKMFANAAAKSGRPGPGIAYFSRRSSASLFDTAFAKLVSAGTAVVQTPHDTGNNNRNALLRDPDGNLVEIVAKVAKAPSS